MKKNRERRKSNIEKENERSMNASKPEDQNTDHNTKKVSLGPNTKR